LILSKNNINIKIEAKLIKSEINKLNKNFPKKTLYGVEISFSNKIVPFSSSLTKLRAIPVIEAKKITTQINPAYKLLCINSVGMLKLIIVVEINVKRRVIDIV
jgi:hypothetical protein